MGSQTSKCSDEGQSCTFNAPAPVAVAYGADNQYYFKNYNSGPQNIPCNNATFGDPAQNVNKECLIKRIPSYTTNKSNVPVGYTVCANQGGFCTNNTNGPVDLLYGADGSYTYGFLNPGQIVTCDNNTFPGSSITTNAACYIAPQSSNIMPISPVAPIAPVTPSNNCMQQTCIDSDIWQGRNINGFNMVGSPVYTINNQKCLDQCNKTPGCDWYNYDTINNACYLKQGTANSNDISTVFRIKNNPPNTNCPIWSTKPNTNIKGFDMVGGDIYARSETDCQNECLVRDCDWYNYKPPAQIGLNSNCYLKQALVSPNMNTGFSVSNN